MESKKSAGHARANAILNDVPYVVPKASEYGIVPTLSRLNTDPLEAYLQESVITAKNRKEYMKTHKGKSHGNSKSSTKFHSRNNPREENVKRILVKEQAPRRSANDERTAKVVEHRPNTRAASKSEFKKERNFFLIKEEDYSKACRANSKDSYNSSRDESFEYYDQTSSKGDARKYRERPVCKDKDNAYEVYDKPAAAEDLYKLYDRDRTRKEERPLRHHRLRNESSKSQNRRNPKEEVYNKAYDRSVSRDAYKSVDRGNHKDEAYKSKDRAAADEVFKLYNRSGPKGEGHRQKRTHYREEALKPSQSRGNSKDAAYKLYDRGTKAEGHRNKERSAHREHSSKIGHRGSKEEVYKVYDRVALQEDLGSDQDNYEDDDVEEPTHD